MGLTGCIKGVGRLVAVYVALGAPAQAALSPFSGFWQLESQQRPSTPQMTDAARAQSATFVRDGSALTDELKWCVMQGLPFVMEEAGPIDIIVGPHEVVMFAERLALQRHLYIAGQKRPDPAVYDPTSVGHTSASLRGNTLTADTIGLSPGVGPAGVPRTENSRVVEKFTVNGDTLKVESTWTDPTMLRQPYRYTLVYRRLPAGYTAPESYCDPRKNGVGVH